jgi:outer membrane protein TolC
MKGNAELRAQRLQELQAAQDLRRVGGEFGPRFEALVGMGPITKASGNATASVEDKSSIGRMFIGKLSLTQPLFTWGRKGNYENAATAGIHVKEAESALKENDLRFEVKEAYHGYQLANSFRDFIEGGKAELTKALEGRKAKKRREEKPDYRLEIFLGEVQAREAEVKKYLELAREGLALRLGQPRGTVQVKDEWIIPETRQRKPVEDYVAMAHASRPEFRQLNEGIFAKRSLAKAEKKALLPVLVFLASYELADTNVRPQQPGVFSYDPYNRDTYTLGVGFKLDFQWSLQDSKSAKLRAEAEELSAKEEFAIRGVETEVRKAYLEVEEAEARLDAARRSYDAGKKWLTSAVIGYSSGLGAPQGLVDAYGARAETTKSYFEAVHRHHMAWAMLSKVVGAEVDPILSSL